MLTTLTIKNIVLIEQLHLDLSGGLTTLTGETGAGKSILLDALGLALGKRADAGLVRQGNDKGIVTAVFDLPPEHPAMKILAAQDLDIESDGEIIIRRSLNADGRSKASVNDQPVSIGFLKTLGTYLVEVHGQFDTAGLLDNKTHMKTLDRYGQLEPAVQNTATAFTTWQESRSALNSARTRADEARAQEEYLRYAVEELDKLAPVPGEEEDLSAKRKTLMHREKIAEAYNIVTTLLGEDGGISDQVNSALAALDKITAVGGDIITQTYDALSRAQIEIEDAAGTLDRLGDMDDDSLNADEIEERLFALKDCARKHNCTINELPEKRDELQERLNLVDDLEATLNRLESDVAEKRKVYLKRAQELSSERKKTAAKLETAIMTELPDLKMERAVFAVTFTAIQDDTHWSANGIDRIAFEVATNPGSAPGPLQKIASGGELSRFMLALKLALSETSDIPTLIFDEIDSGVGGRTADAIGSRLKRLSEDFQILVVTHSAQIAAKGAQHWQISKSITKYKTVTAVTPLSPDQRLEEVARMLAGDEITEEARAAAAKLVNPKAA